MDIHKNFIQACAVDEKGGILNERRFSSDLQGISGFVQSLPQGELCAAIESTCTWYHVYEKLASLHVNTTLVNVRRTKVIAESKIKTDKLDARSLSHCLRTGFIATAYIPPKEIIDRRDILRHYISLGRDLSRQKNKIQAILLRNGIKHHFSDIFGKAGMIFLKNLTLRPSEKYRLDSYLRIVETLLEERKQTKRRIISLCQHNKQAMLLTSIPGISYVGAMIILSEIGEITRFRSAKKLCNYAGLVPRTIQSGSHTYHGHILKECNTNLKWILNQCTHVHIRHCLKSPITKHYYKLVNKKGNNKATVAASRKMLTCIWHMLMKDETFKYNN
jgi:transposase